MSEPRSWKNEDRDSRPLQAKTGAPPLTSLTLAVVERIGKSPSRLWQRHGWRSRLLSRLLRLGLWDARLRGVSNERARL